MSQVLHCPGNLTDPLCSTPEAKAQDPRCRTRPVVALTPQPDILSGRSTDRHGNNRRNPGTCSESAPQLRSESSVLIPAVPPPPGPLDPRFSPSFKMDSPTAGEFERGTIHTERPRGSGAHAHSGPGDRDHPPLPPLRAAASRPHSAGGGRRGTRGRGWGRGGGGAGEAFPACAVPRPATGSCAQTIERKIWLEEHRPGRPMGLSPRASAPCAAKASDLLCNPTRLNSWLENGSAL